MVRKTKIATNNPALRLRQNAVTIGSEEINRTMIESGTTNKTPIKVINKPLL
jgi:hypothetical protein